VHDNEHQLAAAFLRQLPSPWTAGSVTAQKLAPLLLTVAAAKGWQLDDALAAKLTENPGGVHNYRAVLPGRIEDLPQRQQGAKAAPSLPRWCRKCADGDPAAADDPSMRQITNADGRPIPCPECSIQATQSHAA
jgi:hypothetical protein